MEMRVISHKKIIIFGKKHPDARNSLDVWYRIVKQTDFNSFAEIRKTFPSADVYEKFTIFNIGGNKYRLIVTIHYNRKMVFIRNILTHNQYNKNSWKEQ